MSALGGSAARLNDGCGAKPPVLGAPEPPVSGTPGGSVYSRVGSKPVIGQAHWYDWLLRSGWWIAHRVSEHPPPK
jgi:hypothetical protein